MPAESNDASFSVVLAELQYLLLSLPPESKLPLIERSQDSLYAAFLNFSLNPELMEKIEDEVGVFSEQFKIVFGWQTRSSGEGIILIMEHGPAICAIVNVLREYHNRYPSDEVIMKWGRDLLRGVRNIYTKNGLDIPSVRDQSSWKIPLQFIDSPGVNGSQAEGFEAQADSFHGSHSSGLF